MASIKNARRVPGDSFKKLVKLKSQYSDGIARNLNHSARDGHQLTPRRAVNFNLACSERGHDWGVVRQYLKQTLGARELHGSRRTLVELTFRRDNVNAQCHSIIN